MSYPPGAPRLRPCDLPAPEFGGPDPEIHECSTTRAEQAALAEKVTSWSGSGIGWSQMAVVARDNADVADLTRFLTAQGIPAAMSTKLPPRWGKQLDYEGRDTAMARERGLLYVSGSRVRERLYVSWTGRPAELLNQPS